MEQFIAAIKEQTEGIWRFRWNALSIGFLIVLVGIPAIYAMPDQYRATARVYVDTQSFLRPLLKGLAVETDMAAEVNVVAQALVGRPQLRRVIERTDLSMMATEPGQVQDLVDALQKRVEIEGSKTPVSRADDIFLISYTDEDGERAARVVQALLDTMVESALGSKRSDVMAAEGFLVKQIDEYERRLAESEQRLAAFKKRNLGLMPSDGRDYYGRLQAAMDALKRTKTELRVARNRRAQLKEQINGGEVSSGLAVNSVTLTIDREIADRQTELDRLLLSFTEKHPDVITLRETIGRLKARRDDQLRQIRLGQYAKVGENDNLVLQNIGIALTQADLDIATLTARESELQKEITDLREMVDTIPEIEAKLADLNRDYTVTKQQYEALVQRLESARISQGAESGNQIKFRIIDPPVVPLEPESPDRLALLLMLPFLGLVIGGGVAWAQHQYAPVFPDKESLRDALGLPVLGAVSLLLTEQRRRRYRMEKWIVILLLVALIVLGPLGALFEESGKVIVRQAFERLKDAI